MVDYSKISKKLDDDKVWFDGDHSECFIVLADVTREEAFKAINLYAEDNGMDLIENEDDDLLEHKDIYQGKKEESKIDDLLYWSKEERPKNAKFVTKGWILSL